MLKSETSASQTPLRPSLNAEEVAKFSRLAAEWWDLNGKFRPLHKFNPVRLGYIRAMAETHFGLDRHSLRPFEGLRCLDIGCGGGLLCEPMARLGAQIVGVDASEANIKTAITHADISQLQIDYRPGTIEGLVEADEPGFDLILNMEVVEHVDNPSDFLQNCAKLLKPGGLMIVATLNKTPKAFALAIVGAEYVLRWLPRGTHDFTKFLWPYEIVEPLEEAGLKIKDRTGISYNPLRDEWQLSRDMDVNYMIVAVKPN